MAEEVMLNNFKLDDSSIAHIVKLIQLGFITGTDIVDHFRMIELVSDDDGNLYLDKSYEKRQAQNIEKMLAEANEKTQDVEES